MNVHVQRTLDESYYLGLDKVQLERRNYNKILNDDKFSPKSDNILLVSQLWLWKIENVVSLNFSVDCLIFRVVSGSAYEACLTAPGTFCIKTQLKEVN